MVLDNRFWKNVTIRLKVSYPLIKVVRLVYSDEKPAMGFIYEEMDRAKEKKNQTSIIIKTGMYHNFFSFFNL